MPVSFNDYADLYLESTTLTYSTILGYEAILRIYWRPKLGEQKIEDIRYSTLLNIEQQINWLSAKTRNNAIVALRAVFSLAYLDMRWPEQSSPAHQLKPGRHQKSLPDPFTADERNRIIEWMTDKPQGLYFRTAFATGMRSGELIALEWSQYDGESFLVHQSRVRGRIKATKNAKPRTVYLPRWLCEELNSHWTRKRGGAIFLNQYKRPYQKPDKLNIVYRRCLQELKIRPRAGPYPWRHTYASVGITEGAKPGYLAKQLGHGLEAFYRTYAEWISKDMDMIQRAIIEETWR
jgi:integrase